jgi:hypothetical protein
MSKVQAAALHALFSPSASPRWIPCPGSMTFPENRSGGSSSTYADAGTARHMLASHCLGHKHNAAQYIGTVYPLNGADYEVDEDFATDVQYYIDDVRNRAVGGHLLVEQKVDLQEWLGPNQFGTSDAVIAQPIEYNVTIEDLKSGRGEKVYAWAVATEASRFTVKIPTGNVDGVTGAEEYVDVEPNFQLMLYGLGSIPLVELLMDEIRTVTLVICQPPLDHIHELTISMDDMRRFGNFVRGAVYDCEQAMALTPNGPDHMFYLNPGEKQCRWCNAKAYCSKLTAYVAEEVRMDFEDVAGDGAPKRPEVPVDTARLAHAYAALPLIQMWSSAVSASVHELVSNGTPVIGSDKKPMKFVEGKLGNRAWTNEKDAESALCGVLPADKAYAPKKIVSPSVAAKMLDKKATKETWKDVFEPLIRRPPGRPILVLGSDPRPPFQKKAGAEDFDEVSSDDE